MISRLPMLVLFAAALPAQGITLLEGTSPASLDVRVLDENNLSAPGNLVLQQVELLPIETTGRTTAQPMQTSRARRDQRNGLVRVELPGGGRLFQYRRQGGASWGYLLVPADGMARSVLERPGLAGNVSPFADRIGVAADGLHAVVPQLDGNLQIVRLDGGSFASTGTPARLVTLPRAVVPQSLLVGRSCAFFATDHDLVMRCALADGQGAVDCTPPPQPNGILRAQFAISGDGSAVAFQYGPRDLWRFFLLRETGTAVLLAPPASKYEEPNYLPEGSGQPLMLLDEHADRLFFVDAVSRDESWLIDLNGVLPALHVTGDGVFQPYIGVHILPAFAQSTLYVAIGDIALMDWYRVELTAAGGSVTNLTATGSSQPPFAAGTIAPTDVVVAGTRMLATEVAPNQQLALRAIDPSTATSQVLFQDLTAPPAAGSAFAGAPDLLASGAGGDRLFVGATGALFVAAPAGIQITPPNRGPLFSATWVHLAGGLGIAAFYLPNGVVLPGPIDSGVTQLVMTARGGCFWNGPTLRYFAPGVLQTLNLPPAAIRWCVSGAGG